MKSYVYFIVAAGFIGMLILSVHAIPLVYHNTPELGPEVIAYIPRWIPVSLVTSLLHIKPSSEAQYVWVKKYNELHILLGDNLYPNASYTVSLGFMPATFTARLPLMRTTIRLPISPLRTPIDTVENESPVIESVQENRWRLPSTPNDVLATNSSTAPSQRGKSIIANISTMVMTLFENGSPVKSYPIAGKGNPATWPTPEGSFSIKTKETNHYSTIAHVWMPWSMQFSGDYFIHEWPYWPSGERLQTKYSGGCIRLHIGDAKEVFDWSEIGTRFAVHSQ